MWASRSARALARVPGVLFPLAALLSAGCATETGPATFADLLYLDTTLEPCGREGARIEILQEPPARHYTRVAYVESFAAFYAKDMVTWERLRNDLCQQASRAGADAIIELTVGHRPYSRLLQLFFVEVSEGGNAKKLTGIAIRYDDPEP